MQLGRYSGSCADDQVDSTGIGDPVLDVLIARLDELPELHRLITSAIAPEASAVITEGNIIRTGFDEQLDQYRVVLRDGTGWIAEIEAKEREASGITGLKSITTRRMATISMSPILN